MERTTITMDGCGRVAVPSDAASVWMSEMELVRLFGVIAPTLRAAIRAVHKSGVLQPCEVERRISQPNGYYADMYALPMVVALAFRINMLGNSEFTAKDKGNNGETTLAPLHDFQYLRTKKT